MTDEERRERKRKRNAEWRAANKDKIAEYQAEYRAANKDRIAEYYAEYYAANKDRIAKRNAEWRAANKDKIAEYYAANKDRIAEYRAANKDRIAEYYAEYRAANKDRIAEYYAEYCRTHPEIARFIKQRRRCRKLNAAGNDYITTELLEARWDYYGRRCYLCGAPATATDHVKPLAKGGAQWPCNLRPICSRCNSIKNAKWPYDFEAHKAKVANLAPTATD